MNSLRIIATLLLAVSSAALARDGESVTAPTGKDVPVASKTEASEKPPAQVEISGGFRHPHKVNWTRELTLLTAIGVGAGFGWDNGNNPVYVIRNGVKTRYSIKDIIRKKIPDPFLLPGDVVFTPE